MISIITKNLYFYRRNWKELVSFLLRVYVGIIPIYLFTSSVSSSKTDMGFILSTIIIVGIFSKIIIAANYELYKEVNQGKLVNIQMAGLSIFKYILAQILFNFVLYVIQYLILIIIFNYNGIFIISLSLSNILILLFLIVIVVCLSTIISVLLSILTILTRSFSYSSMLIIVLFLFSSTYTKFENTKSFISSIYLISPLTYLVNMYRYVLIGETLIFDLPYMFIIMIVQTVILMIIVKLIINKYLKKVLEKPI